MQEFLLPQAVDLRRKLAIRLGQLAEAKGVGKILRFSADVWRDHACCLTMMHEQDVTERPEWTQKGNNKSSNHAIC